MAFNEDNPSFDRLLLNAAMQLAAENGWHNFTLVDAALAAGLPLEKVRENYPCKSLILIKLNELVDKTILCHVEASPSLRERIFDLFMRRFDAFQDYREGLKSVMRTLPLNPALAALLGLTTFNTIKWVADVAGLDYHGLSGKLRLQTLLIIWTQTLRTWKQDDTPDLSYTMKTLDKALSRAERLNLLKTTTEKNLSAFNDSPSAGGLPDYKPEDSENVSL